MTTDRSRSLVALSPAFLRHVLLRVTDLAELKAILYVASLAEETGSPSVSIDRLVSPEGVRAIAGEGSPRPGPERVREALQRAVVDGYLLTVRTVGRQSRGVRYLLATSENHDLLARLQGNDADAGVTLGVGPDEPIEVYRPNVFALYERIIGPLTPLVADQVREAERAYPREWIEAAMQQAATGDRRNWRYVEGILRRWETEGAPRGVAQRMEGPW